MTSYDLDKLIETAIEIKTGDKEFLLFHGPGMSPAWVAEIGNPNSSICLGEIRGELSGEGSSAGEAVANLIAAIKAAQ
ncbi:MAG: hypothetical protein M3R16_05045 [Pseudomonadota bacterium]|nr:hypothetical protein [Pseudomonadota bacterium]